MSLKTTLSLQFSKVAEKLKVSEHKYPKFSILIHSAKESLNNTLYVTKPITISARESKTAMITKCNLNSISTEEDPCANDETLTRADSAIKKVPHLMKKEHKLHIKDVFVSLLILFLI